MKIKSTFSVAATLTVLLFQSPAYATSFSASADNIDVEDSNYYYDMESYRINPDGLGGVGSTLPSDPTASARSMETHASYLSFGSAYTYGNGTINQAEPYDVYSDAYIEFRVYLTPTTDFRADYVPIVAEYTSSIHTDGNAYQLYELTYKTVTNADGSTTEVVDSFDGGKFSSTTARAEFDIVQFNSITDVETDLYSDTKFDSSSFVDTWGTYEGVAAVNVNPDEELWVSLYAQAGAYGSTSDGTWTTAEARVENTSFSIDQSWEYASLYEVNYEYVEWPSIAAPVPEPSTLALMLAGFGLIGFKSRRRKKTITI